MSDPTTLTKAAITDQMVASLAMLRACVDQCPDDLWASEPIGERVFWEVAYHIAFYADLYLTPHLDQYPGQPGWAWPHAAGFGRRMEPPFDPLKPEEVGPVLDRDKVAGYLADTADKLHRVMAAETAESLAGGSGFFWYPITRLAMHLVNLRHVMHHTGQLCAALRRKGIAVEWMRKGD